MIPGPHHRNDLCFTALLPFKVQLSMFHLITFTGSKQLSLRGTALSDYMTTAKPFPFTPFLSDAAASKTNEQSRRVCR